ncbi:MAG: conjugal transfer protein TraX [Epulopiscium sp.]|nr:conjugal transfer protein TraX [Candidatus Epulonipiscium sp.]
MEWKGFTSFQLKFIMTIFMLLDHIAQFIPGAPIWFHYIGRLVAPIFFYLLVEGFYHTRDRIQYMKRLYIGALFMFIGSSLLDTVIFPQEGYGIPNNIFLSLALGIHLLYFIESIKRKESTKDKRIEKIKAIFIGFLSLFSEASFLGLGMVLIFYFFREDRKKLSVGYLLLSSFFIFSMPLTYENLFLLNYQWMMAFALPFFFLYNGQQGRKVKNFFYIFYPLHIWILYSIGYFMS